MKPLTTVYLDAKGRLIAETAGPDARSHRPIAFADMGPWLPVVIVEMEDRRFYSHSGVDAWGTARAFIEQYGGGSTITQQLVKIATGRKGRSLLVKAREALLAMQLERRWSKQQILEAYLNRIPFGTRLIGVEAAAQAYFGRPAAALTKAEAVYLAGLPREPSRLNPWSHLDAAQKRFEGARQLLMTRGYLSSREGAEMLPPVVEKHLPADLAPNFVQLAAQTGHRGVVRCTLDLDIQRRAEELVRDNLNMLHRPDITEAAMVVIENESGAVRALVGSRDFKQHQIDGATLFRNSGSTLKPFLYVTGIDRRVFTAATLLPDTAEAARDAYMDYDPHNFVLSHLGPVRVREALGNSLNVPAVVAVSRIGARTAYNAIGNWGMKFDRPLEKTGAGFILGNVGVRLLDLTAAFSGLARGGLAGPPRFIEGDAMPLRRMVSADAAAIVTDILCDNNARLQGFGARSPLAFPVRIAAKTGTSAGFRDAWAEGFTREHTVGVWVGNFDGRPMDHAASAASAAPLWRRMVDDLLLTDHPVPGAELPRVHLSARSPDCARVPRAGRSCANFSCPARNRRQARRIGLRATDICSCRRSTRDGAPRATTSSAPRCAPTRRTSRSSTRATARCSCSTGASRTPSSRWNSKPAIPDRGNVEHERRAARTRSRRACALAVEGGGLDAGGGQRNPRGPGAGSQCAEGITCGTDRRGDLHFVYKIPRDPHTNFT